MERGKRFVCKQDKTLQRVGILRSPSFCCFLLFVSVLCTQVKQDMDNKNFRCVLLLPTYFVTLDEWLFLLTKHTFLQQML